MWDTGSQISEEIIKLKNVKFGSEQAEILMLFLPNDNRK